MYLMNTRPYIYFVVNTLSQFLTNSIHVHLIVANHIPRYLKGTVDYGLKYDVNQKINLEGYVDSDWVGSAIDSKITSWCSRKKSCMALSTAERGAVKLQYVIQIEISRKREF